MCESFNWIDRPEPLLCQLEDRKEYCLFHAPGDLKDHKTLMDAVWERVNCVLKANVWRGENDQKTCNLSGTVFDGDVNFNRIRFPCTLIWESSFGGKASFWNASFTGSIDFLGSKFKKEADFMDAEFTGDSLFSGASFEGKADFRSATFEGEAHFRNATFEAEVDFFDATFGGEADFEDSKFAGQAHFWDVKFRKKANFSSATFSSFMIADQAIFEGKTSFEKATFEKNASFSQTTFKEVSFPLSRFYEEPIFDRADLRKAELLDAPVEDFRLIAPKLPTCRGRRITYDARKVNGSGYFPLDYENDATTPNHTPPSNLEDLYRRLKKSPNTKVTRCWPRIFITLKKTCSEQTVGDGSPTVIPRKQMRLTVLISRTHGGALAAALCFRSTKPSAGTAKHH